MVFMIHFLECSIFMDCICKKKDFDQTVGCAGRFESFQGRGVAGFRILGARFRILGGGGQV